MKTILLKAIAGFAIAAIGGVFGGCSLLTAGGFGFSSGPYSSWKSVRHNGEKFLASPYEKDEFYLKKYDCFLWGSLDYPVRLMIGYLILYCKDFPYFCVYQRGVTEKIDVREDAARDYEVEGYTVQLRIRRDVPTTAQVTIVHPDGGRRDFKMPLATAAGVAAEQP